MNTETVPVNVTIMDKEYRIACKPTEKAALLASAELLNDRLREIRDTGRVIGADRMAVMVALNLAHELLNEQTANKALLEKVGSRLHALRTRTEEALTECAGDEPQ